VVADIADIARGCAHRRRSAAAGERPRAGKAPMQRHEGGYYIRCWRSTTGRARPPSPQRMAEQHISLESIVHGDDPPRAAPVPVILITYATTEDAVRKALDAVKADKVISGEPQLIRIEKIAR
jgi:homoserine dehydrogenase